MELQQQDNMITSKVEDSSKCCPKMSCTGTQNCKSRCEKVENIFCTNSSVFVANRIGRSTSVFRKIFWLCILVFGTIGCLSQVIQYLTCYFTYPVVVNLESYNSKFLDFPGVTICNMNPVQKQFQSCVEKKLNYDECINPEEKDEHEAFIQNTSMPSCSLKPEDVFMQNNSRAWLNLLSLNYDSRVKYGHQIKDLIKTCTINEMPCIREDFKTSLSYYYGNCFTYVPRREQMYPLFPGPESGLELELDIEILKYATFSDSAGLRVEMHDPRVRHNVDEKGIIVSPGTKTYVAVTKTIVSRLPAPYKDRCRVYTEENSQSSCIDLCLHNITTTKCFCSLLNNKHDDVPQCDIRDPSVFCCLKENYKDKDCDCPLPCEETVYNIQVSSAVWPTKVNSGGVTFECVGRYESKDIFPCKNIQDTRLILKVYWDTFEFTVYKQQPMFQSSEVLSQIGGQMGLWLGISIIAVFEALENIILFFKRV